jgi:translocation and assembly module TamB
VAGAPPGALALTARGAAAGRSLRDLRARLSARVERSRLRGGEVRSAEIAVRADRGDVELSRMIVSAPGIALDGVLSWRDGGPVSGRLAADATDLAALAKNAGALLGREPAALAGRARLDLTLSGTSPAPAGAAKLEAQLVRVGGVSFAGASVSAYTTGPLRTISGRVEGRVAGVRIGERELVRAVLLRAALAEEEGSVEVSGSLPGFTDPARLEARGRLGPGRESLRVSTLALSYPGERWILAAPAIVTLAGPSVDRLELASGARRLMVRGGLGPWGDLDAGATVAGLDLARLPAGLLPPEDAIRGELSADVRATGTSARPEVALSFTVAGGAFRTVSEISVIGSAGWSGATRRATASVALSRGAGGTLDVRADLPLPLAGRPGQPVRLTVRGADLPLEDVLLAAGSDAPASGVLSLDGAVEGSAGAPTFRLAAGLTRGEWRDLDALVLDLTAEDAGERLRVSVRARHDGKSVLAADAEAPLDLAELLARPAAGFAALWRAPLEGSFAVTGLDLAPLSGRAGIPAGLAATVDAAATLSGSLARPRAEGTVDVARGTWAGYRDLGGHASVSLADAAMSADGRVTVTGEEAARFQLSLGVPVERVTSLERLRPAALRAEVIVPRLSLGGAAPADVPLAGTLAGRLTVSGTPGAPEVTLLLEGDALSVAGKPLGGVRLEASYARARTAIALALSPTSGGTLRGTLAVEADLGVGAARPALGEAPAEATAVAAALDLGLLAAAAPGLVRSAGGKLTMDVRAKGPLARLLPRGTLRVEDGRLALSEWGEWTGIALDVAATDDAVEVSRLEVRRGSGRLVASGALRGLRAGTARLDARLDAKEFTVARAGMDLATLDLRAEATGTYAARVLAVDVAVPGGVVRLPQRSPRDLQTLERRKDIVVGRPSERRRRAGRPAGVAAESPSKLTVHVVVPRNLFVKSDDPRVDVELKADVRYERAGAEEHATGTVDVIRGTVEPIASRTFTLERGRVQLTGGPLAATMLDVEARYRNPAAVVTVTVQGPAAHPEIRLESQPPMDEGKIAMLIATGRVDLKAGSGGVGTLTGEEAGRAALGALATQAFRNLVAKKLPLDTVALDSGAVRAGKYVTDKIYVGYTRRFEADPARGENSDEVRVEYQINRRWTFESRYGNAQSGGASLIWSKEY